MTNWGDLYYEGKEFEIPEHHFKPGFLSDKLKCVRGARQPRHVTPMGRSVRAPWLALPWPEPARPVGRKRGLKPSPSSVPFPSTGRRWA